MGTLHVRCLALLLTTAATTAFAAPIPGLFNTGVDNNGAALGGGMIDPHYALIESADPAYPGPNAVVASVIPSGFWLPNSGLSMWISPAADENYPDYGTAHPDGNYVYRLSFDLTGFNPATAQLSARWGVDNSGDVFLNGNDVYAGTSSYDPLFDFSITSGFIAGVNHLDFAVYNYPWGGANPTGLRVEFLSSSATAVAGVSPGTEGDALAFAPPSPNPGSGRTHFAGTLPTAGRVRLRIVDVAGRTVRTIADRDAPGGAYSADWDGALDTGGAAAPGLYFARLEFGGNVLSRRVVRVR